MSQEIEWGNWEPSKAPHSVAASEMFNAEFDRQMKVSNYIRSGDDLVAEFDKRTDVVKQLTGVDLGNPMRAPTAPPQYDAMGNVMSPGGMWIDHVTAYKEKLKELADKHPEHKFAIDPDNTPDLIIAQRMKAYEQRSADVAEKAGLIEGQDIPVIGKVPVVREAAALVRNMAVHPVNTLAQFGGSLYAQMHDPVEAPLNLLGFGAGRARDAILKTALKNAASNAAIEAAMGPLRQEQRKNYGLDYGWDRFFADVSGAAAAGFVLDAAVRTPYRAGITRFGRDVPEGQMFSKQGRGGLLTDAIPQMDPIKPVVREKITPEEIERAKANDIDAIESIAKKSGIYDDPSIKGMIDYAKLGGRIDDEMVKRFEAMKIDHGEGMATLKAAIEVGGLGYVRTPDPIPEATRALDTAGAAELAPRLAEIDQRLADAPQNVRQAIRAGIEAGIPEIVDAARKAVSGDLEGMRKAIADAGGEQALTDRVIVHTATNPISVARALRRSPQVMDSNVSLRTDMMRMARALSALDEPAFRMVLEGKAHPLAGQIVADMVPPGRHAQVLEQVANFRSMEDAKAAIPDLIPEPSRAPEATGTRVSDPAGPEAKAQIEDLEKAHKAEVDRATEPARKREELESKVETLRGEIAKLEEEAAAVAPDPTLQRKRELLARIEKDMAKRDSEYAFLSDYKTNRKAIEKRYKSQEAYDRALERLSIDNGDKARADALRAEIAKLEEQQGKLFAIGDGTATPIEKIGPDAPHPGKVIAYHGSPSRFDKFDPARITEFGFHFGSERAASTARDKQLMKKWLPFGGNVRPVELDIKNPIAVTDVGRWDDPFTVAYYLNRDGGLQIDWQKLPQKRKGATDRQLADGMKTIKTALAEQGFDGIRYINHQEGAGAWSYIVWNEGQVKNARTQEQMFAIADRGKASLDETILSPPEQKLLAKLTERTGLKPEDIAEQRAQGQSFGKKIDAALDKATKFEGAEKAADELATKRQELRAAERELEQVQLDQARTLQDPALFNAVMRRAALQRQLDVRRAIDDALRLGNRMLPENTRVEVRTDEMVDPASGYRLDASSDMATGDIALASYALNPAGRIGHEGVHTLITKGHVAPEEVKLLAKMARERGLFKDETKYREAYANRDNLDALIDEEAAAHAIEARINGTDIGPANTMADRIKQLIERIKNALDGYGFKTADDVARAIIEGRAAEREARAEWMRDEARQKMRDAAERGVTLPDGTQIKGVPLYAIRAFHGSPHDFDKFDLSKIGTGEGAQAFGHGLYFAESEGVAKTYRDALGNYDNAVKWKGAEPPTPEQKRIIDQMSGFDVGRNRQPDLNSVRTDITRAINQERMSEGMPGWDAERSARRVADLRKQLDTLDGMKDMVEVQPPGRMYEVNIKADPADFLDWDKPLGQQGETGRKAAATLGPSDGDPLLMRGHWRVTDMMERARDQGGKRSDVTERLREAGIPGIKYLDQGSRGAGEGSRNYVVFDDSLIEIVAKDGKPVNREQMFAIADTNTGRSMRADLDRLGYYSKALEAAKSLKQAKGTPEQMLAQLKAAGVKDAEIEATNLRGFLDGKTSITRDEIVKHLTENRVGVNEVNKGKGYLSDFKQRYEALRREGRNEEADAIAREYYNADHETNAAGVQWQSYSLDPSNPTYRETVLHLPERGEGFEELDAALNKLKVERDEIESRIGPDVSNASKADMDAYDGIIARIEQRREALRQNKQETFRSGHFSEPNIIGHMMTSMNRHEGKPVFTLDQIQSDWGQKLRDGGVRDEAKIAELRKRYEAALAELDPLVREMQAIPLEQKYEPHTYGSMEQQPYYHDAPFGQSVRLTKKAAEVDARMADASNKVALIEAELRTAEASSPGHPLVNTTDQWTITTLRRALRQAAEADAAYVAIPHGDTVLSYNPGDEGGMRGFYGSRTSEGIVPKNLRKLLEKIDKDSAKPALIDKLETPSGMKGSGFTIFPLTDRVKSSVMEEGQALFALSREPLDMSPEARKARAEQMGFDTGKVWYHGAARSDRIADAGKFDPKRATSGPMAFFTDDPKIASNYAKGKADTSLNDDGEIAKYFTVSPKDLGDARGRTPYTVEQTWYRLSPEQRADIAAKAKRVGYENPQEATGPLTLHSEGTDASLNGSHFDYILKTEARGNVLTALRIMWHDSGELFGQPEEMMNIWRLAGYPHKISDKTAPWYEAQGVLPVYMKMRNPLDTSDTAALARVVDALDEAFKRDRSRLKEYGADGWDKNSRYTPKEWVKTLRDDIAAGKSSFVFTSIPDKVTEQLRVLGYDGILDRGGKMGGAGHDVAIPFDPQQVRSVNATFDPAEAGSARLLAAFNDNTPPDPLKSDMAVVDRLNKLKELIEACR